MKKTLLMAALAAAVVGGALGCGGKGTQVKPAPAAPAPDTAAAVPDTATTFTDRRDGKVYRIVQIGRQVWFAENLNYAAEGSKCYGEDGKVEEVWGAYIGDPPIALSKEEVQSNCAIYGRLYNWETALTACPAGTHLPSDEEWTTLVDYAGGGEIADKKLKGRTEDITGDDYGDAGNTYEYGFSALPGGRGDGKGIFFADGIEGDWWSATEDSVGSAWNRHMWWYIMYGVERYSASKTYLSSVRCVVDKEAQK